MSVVCQRHYCWQCCHCQHIKFLLLQRHLTNFNKNRSKHPWMKEIQVLFQWRATPHFQGGDQCNLKLLKIWWHLKKISSVLKNLLNREAETYVEASSGSVKFVHITINPWVRGGATMGVEFNIGKIREKSFKNLLRNNLARNVCTGGICRYMYKCMIIGIKIS